MTPLVNSVFKERADEMSCPDVYFYFPLSHVEFQLTGREQTVAGIKALRCNQP